MWNLPWLKPNVEERKFTQPRRGKVCSRAPLIGTEAPLRLGPMHRAAGRSALALPCSPVAWTVPSPWASAAGVCFCDTHNSASPQLKQVKLFESDAISLD